MKMVSCRTVLCRGAVIGEGRPKIAVPVVAGDIEELHSQMKILEGHAYDIIEFRADFFEEVETKLQQVLTTVRSYAGETPVLFTFRSRDEGGVREMSYEEYASLNRKAAESGLVDLVDVELGTDENRSARLVEELHSAGVLVVGSYHNFAETPSEEFILAKIAAMQKAGMDITKIAVMPECREDVARFITASVHIGTQIADRPYITMSMGKLGVVSRMAGSLTGSAVTFAAVGKTSAPGQISSEDLLSILEIMD